MKHLPIFLALLCSAAAMAQVDFKAEFEPDEHTVLLLHFNEKEGKPANAADAKIKVAKMKATLTEEGKFGGGLSLEEGILSVAHHPTLVMAGQMTVEMWIKPTEEDVGKGYHILAHKRAKPGRKLYLVLHNGRLRAYPDTTGRSRLVAGTWFHVAYVVTGTKEKGGREYLFINGLLDAERESTWEGVVEQVPLRLGGLPRGTERFKGVIDEVRISNVARPYPGVVK